MKLFSRLFAKRSSAPVADYVLYRSRADAYGAEDLLLSYEWDESFENREWRLCVKGFLHEIEILTHDPTLAVRLPASSTESSELTRPEWSYPP